MNNTDFTQFNEQELINQYACASENFNYVSNRIIFLQQNKPPGYMDEIDGLNIWYEFYLQNKKTIINILTSRDKKNNTSSDCLLEIFPEQTDGLPSSKRRKIC